MFRPESTSIFLTIPVDILCNFRKSQTMSIDILQEVENVRPLQKHLISIDYDSLPSHDTNWSIV